MQDYNEEISEIITEFLEDKITDQEIKKLYKSISAILIEETNKLIMCYNRANTYKRKEYLRGKDTNTPCSINIILMPPPQNNFYSNSQYPFYQYQTPFTTTPNYFNYQTQPINFLPLTSPLPPPPFQPTLNKHNSITKTKHKTKTKSKKHSKKSKSTLKSTKTTTTTSKSTKEKNPTSKTSKKNLTLKKFMYYEGQEFKGIINYFIKKTDGKIENEFDITVSTIYPSNLKMASRQPKTLTYFNNHSQAFLTDNKPNGWICYDFREKRIIPSFYTLRTISWWNKSVNNNPKSWVVECSNDKNVWVEMDGHENSDLLSGSDIVRSFPLRNNSGTDYRYIRIRQTDKNHNNTDLFGLDSFEIYGILIE